MQLLPVVQLIGPAATDAAVELADRQLASAVTAGHLHG